MALLETELGLVQCWSCNNYLCFCWLLVTVKHSLLAWRCWYRGKTSAASTFTILFRLATEVRDSKFHFIQPWTKRFCKEPLVKHGSHRHYLQSPSCNQSRQQIPSQRDPSSFGTTNLNQCRGTRFFLPASEICRLCSNWIWPRYPSSSGHFPSSSFPQKWSEKVIKIDHVRPTKYHLYSRALGVTTPSVVQSQVWWVHTQLIKVSFIFFYEMLSVEFHFNVPRSRWRYWLADETR